ncbi:hypothetical protein EYF80_010366 [Liparis tanakae]|uniref:Uncharacterized protein n=1 Tax=Liparis tanakae TaxID=230148 RepID=A0A4Z2IQ56_9TELE|nr:hypothetical protein EYF80_010366 [Liparis tanakae]
MLKNSPLRSNKLLQSKTLSYSSGQTLNTLDHQREIALTDSPPGMLRQIMLTKRVVEDDVDSRDGARVSTIGRFFSRRVGPDQRVVKALRPGDQLDTEERPKMPFSDSFILKLSENISSSVGGKHASYF